MRLQRLAAVVALGLSLAALGAGNKPRRAAELVKDAEKLYLQAKYKEAAELLKKAHEIEPDPKILYNIARALDQAGDLPASLDYYRQYVASSETDPTLLKRASLSIERLRTLINKQEAAQVQADAARKKLEDETAVAQQKAADEQKRFSAERVASEQRRKIESQRDIDNYRAARLWSIVAHYEYEDGFEFDYVLARGVPTQDLGAALADCGRSHSVGSVVRYHCYPVAE